MWNRIKEIIRTYAFIVLGVEIAVAAFISIFYPGISLSVALLWQVLASSFVCVLGNLIWWTSKRINKKEVAIRILLHYLYINVVVFGSAFLFDWIKFGSIIMVLSMFVMILIVFVLVFLATWCYGKRISEMMNRGLEAYREREEGITR